MSAYPPDRMLRDLVRTAHLAAMAWWLGSALVGGAVGLAPAAVLLSGSALFALQLRREGVDGLRYLSSLAVLAKLGLALLAAVWPAAAQEALLAALVLGGVFSHAPGRVRQVPLWGEPGPCALRGSCEERGREGRLEGGLARGGVVL